MSLPCHCSFFWGWDGAIFANFAAQLQACSRLNLSELASECEQVRTIMQDCGYWLGGYLIHIIFDGRSTYSHKF